MDEPLRSPAHCVTVEFRPLRFSGDRFHSTFASPFNNPTLKRVRCLPLLLGAVRPRSPRRAATHTSSSRGLSSLAVKLRGTGEATTGTPQSGTNGVLLRRSGAHLAPVRKSIQALCVSQLHLTASIYVYQPELESSRRNGPMDHDLLTIR